MNKAVHPRPLPRVLTFGLVPVASWFIARPLLDPAPPIPALYTCLGFSLFALLATLHLIPALGPTFLKANLYGKDLLKVYDTKMSGSSPVVVRIADSNKTREYGISMRICVHPSSHPFHSIFILRLVCLTKPTPGRYLYGRVSSP